MTDVRKDERPENPGVPARADEPAPAESDAPADGCRSYNLEVLRRLEE